MYKNTTVHESLVLICTKYKRMRFVRDTITFIQNLKYNIVLLQWPLTTATCMYAHVDFILQVINLKKFYSDMRIIQRRPSPLSMYSKALLISEKGISWVMNFSRSSSCHIWNNSEEEKSVRKVIHVEISINFQFFHVS